MNPALEAALLGLGKSALELLPEFIVAVKEKRKQDVRDIGEEMLRREAFETRQRERVKAKK